MLAFGGRKLLSPSAEKKLQKTNPEEDTKGVQDHIRKLRGSPAHEKLMQFVRNSIEKAHRRGYQDRTGEAKPFQQRKHVKLQRNP